MAAAAADISSPSFQVEQVVYGKPMAKSEPVFKEPVL
jgi:hypothetical protein